MNVVYVNMKSCWSTILEPRLVVNECIKAKCGFLQNVGVKVEGSSSQREQGGHDKGKCVDLQLVMIS